LSFLSQGKILAEVDSTNTYLLQHPELLFCTAEMQTQGRGRLHRQWLSPLAYNIYFSWRFVCKKPQALGGLSLAVAVMVRRALQQYDTALQPLLIKWPNDLLWPTGEKIAGILLELDASARDLAVIIGIGINGYLAPASRQQIERPLTDIFTQTLRPVKRNFLLALLIQQLVSGLAQFEQAGLSAFLPEWQAADALANKTLTLLQNEREIMGEYQGINQQGELLLRLSSGRLQSFQSGEVSIRFP
jgi:BirA family biotin operon repressor/biotin-[acetyl-CoA-carboxylase] ligase